MSEDAREPGAQHPHKYVVFPRPWPIPPSPLSGWFCPPDEWPEQHNEREWPGHDTDTEPDDEDGAE